MSKGLIATSVYLYDTARYSRNGDDIHALSSFMQRHFNIFSFMYPFNYMVFDLVYSGKISEAIVSNWDYLTFQREMEREYKKQFKSVEDAVALQYNIDMDNEYGVSPIDIVDLKLNLDELSLAKIFKLYVAALTNKLPEANNNLLLYLKFKSTDVETSINSALNSLNPVLLVFLKHLGIKRFSEAMKEVQSIHRYDEIDESLKNEILIQIANNIKIDSIDEYQKLEELLLGK